MKSNHNHPKNEFDFYKRQYSVHELIKNFDFQDLMGYYVYGMNTIKAINEIIDNDRYDLVDLLPHEVKQDKMYFVMRTTIVKNAISKINVCDVINTDDKIILLPLN